MRSMCCGTSCGGHPRGGHPALNAVRPWTCPTQGSRGVFSARQFVWWYNGHPDCATLPVDLSRVESVAVCGIGNVALDCARVLLQPLPRLARTDVAAHAVAQFAEASSRIRRVHLVARRGPAQVGLRQGEGEPGHSFITSQLCLAALRAQTHP